MTTLEWVITLSVCFLILFSLFFLVSFFLFIKNKKNYQNLLKKKFKKNKLKKRKKFQLKKISKQKRKYFILSIMSLIIVIVSGSIAVFTKTYEMSNMSESDIANIADGYYLISQVNDELIKVKDSDISSPEKISENIHSLSIRLAAFSAKKGSDRTSTDGQYLLNKYYSSLGQFGLNLSSQTYNSLIQDKNLLEDFLSDISKIEKQQTKTLEYFKIQESSLTTK